MSVSNWNADHIADQTGRRVVITGATSGIGMETARVLVGKGAAVIIGGRNPDKAQDVVDSLRRASPDAQVSARTLDLADLASVQDFARSINDDFDRLDVLINNAGVMMCPYARTADGFEMQMGTNHLGHFALTGHLLSLLRATPGSRIVVLSSIAHRFGNIDFADLNWEERRYNTSRAYSDSKLANLLFAHELRRRLNGADDPTVTIAHPGWTATELQRHTGPVRVLNRFFAQGVDQGALPTLRAGFDVGARAGDYYGPSRFFELHGDPVRVKCNDRAHDAQAASRLWELSEAMTGVGY